MLPKHRLVMLIGVLALAGLPTAAAAGPFGDDLSRCLVKSTTATDRARFVRWMFAAASRHPEVSDLATVSDETLRAANKAVGETFVNLLTETCAEEAKLAIQFEGIGVIQTSFQVFGQVAGAELFSNPEVTKATAGMEEFLDAKRREALVKP